MNRIAKKQICVISVSSTTIDIMAAEKSYTQMAQLCQGSTSMENALILTFRLSKILNRDIHSKSNTLTRTSSLWERLFAVSQPVPSTKENGLMEACMAKMVS